MSRRRSYSVCRGCSALTTAHCAGIGASAGYALFWLPSILGGTAAEVEDHKHLVERFAGTHNN
eukprot:6203156-Pleurochrysis_carterae.AAC.5